MIREGASWEVNWVRRVVADELDMMVCGLS